MADIQDEDWLLRRVFFTDPNYVKDDGTVTSLAFKPRGGESGLSVDIERLTTYEKSIQDRSRFRLFHLQASVPRQIGLDVIHDRLPDNPAHALITGQITRPISRALAMHARRVPFPD